MLRHPGWEQNYADYPERFDPAGHVIALEQVSENRYCQPEPSHEREQRLHIHKEVCKTEAPAKSIFVLPNALPGT